MHDIDRTQLEFSPEMEAFEGESFESDETEYEAEWEAEAYEVFSEDETMDLAGELLAVTSEMELEQFLGDLMNRAAKTVGTLVTSPVGQQLGGILKGAAKKTLPLVGSAIGRHFGGASGAKLGSQAASAAGRLFGLELEGLSEEDQEFEVAKSFVKFAGDAVKKAASNPSKANPKAIAKAAVTAAARQRAPGFLSSAAPSDKACPTCGRRSSGRWIRRNNQIVLIGA